MNSITLRREGMYGVPAADQILVNRHYVVGYSFYFRQPKWTLEIINPPVIDPDPDLKVERQDHFRKDFRVAYKFRAEKVDFKGSGYDRGHMVASANHVDVEIQNSETFLLTNMSPQFPNQNRGVWRNLEEAVRKLNAKKTILETFCITGPIFYFDKPIVTIGDRDKNMVTIPVPHAHFKSILTESSRGTFKMWSFIVPNIKRAQNQPLETFQVSTEKVEVIAGVELWNGLRGTGIGAEKRRIRKIW